MPVQVLYTIVGLWCPLKYVVRAGMFLGLWFVLMHPPVSWAKQAQEWQEAGAATARAFSWTTDFLRVHSIMWRLLLVFLLYTTVGLVRSALGKHLSIHTHHTHHFPRMQECNSSLLPQAQPSHRPCSRDAILVGPGPAAHQAYAGWWQRKAEGLGHVQEALVNETVIRQLAKPHGLSPHATVYLSNSKLSLRGYGPAHWAALQYVERLLGHIGFWEDDHTEDGFIDSLRTRSCPRLARAGAGSPQLWEGIVQLHCPSALNILSNRAAFMGAHGGCCHTHKDCTC